MNKHAPTGDRRKLELMPLRMVVKRYRPNPTTAGTLDTLSCGHRLADPYGNWNKRRRCRECPPLAEPVSEVARLRRVLVGQVENIATVRAWLGSDAGAMSYEELGALIGLIDAVEPLAAGRDPGLHPSSPALLPQGEKREGRDEEPGGAVVSMGRSGDAGANG